ncbi:MAG: class I SAM-dependent methyltransferase [Vulcanimicrobiaceae bacterium]
MDFETYYEDRNRAKFVTSDNPHNEMLVKRMAEWLELRQSDSLLDVGCSDGYFLEKLYARTAFRSGVGVDISPSTVAAARGLVNVSALHFEVGVSDALPFDDQSFDKLVVNELIEHVPDDEGSMKEFARVLKPGGLAYVTAPNSMREMLPIFRSYCAKVDRVEGHLRRYSVAEFSALAKRQGFELVKVRYEGFVAGYLWYNFVIYNPLVKSVAMRFISGKAPTLGDGVTRPTFTAFSVVPFTLMRLIAILDGGFSGYRRAMGFHALLRKL